MTKIRKKGRFIAYRITKHTVRDWYYICEVYDDVSGILLTSFAQYDGDAERLSERAKEAVELFYRQEKGANKI